MELPNPILRFYLGEGRDNAGRTILDVLRFDDHELEYHHDFIQWLFPLETRSGANPLAPTLTKTEIDSFQVQPVLRERLQQAFERMLRFYGLELVSLGDSLTVQKSSNWQERAVNWLSPRNHNHLRITRILISLRTLGLPELATAFYDALERINSEAQDMITPVTFRFWTNAVQ